MRRKWPDLLTPAAIVLLAAILIGAAVLQYRFTRDLGDAERVRMEASLATSVRQFQFDVQREMLRVCSTFQALPETIPERYQEWEQTAPHPALVANVWLAQEDASGELALRSVAPKTAGSVLQWPERLAGVRDHIRDGRAPFEGRRGFPGRMRSLGCELREADFTLIAPVSSFASQPIPTRGPPRILGYALIEINRDALATQSLPELARRHFDPSFLVAVLESGGSSKMLYRSDRALSSASLANPDYAGALLSNRPPSGPRGGGEMQTPRPPGRRRANPGLLIAGEGEHWQLMVQHSSGSLAAAAGALQRRNLAISLGALLILAASMAMILIATHRARRLAQLQIDFVAGVSHELRTPVAVICSAGANLARGRVESGEQLREYGRMIQAEGKRLAGMTEQVMLFAESRKGKPTYDLRPVSVKDLIDSALAESPAIQTEGVTVEKDVPPGLPLAMADRAALARCLDNLISNAAKYSGEAKWMRVTARAEDRSVVVTVEDRGIGIERADQPHIFEPFYRSRLSKHLQIPGTGLGLNLVQGLMEAMNGSVTFESEAGAGSRFTLRLPAVADRSIEADEALPIAG